MSSKTTAKSARPIRFRDIRTVFEQSGFDVRLTTPQTLKQLATKKAARRRSTATTLFGLILPDESQIAVNRSLPLDERAKTLLHELVHLYDDRLTERQTEQTALALFAKLSPEERGYVEFLVS